METDSPCSCSIGFEEIASDCIVPTMEQALQMVVQTVVVMQKAMEDMELKMERTHGALFNVVECLREHRNTVIHFEKKMEEFERRLDCAADREDPVISKMKRDSDDEFQTCPTISSPSSSVSSDVGSTKAFINSSPSFGPAYHTTSAPVAPAVHQIFATSVSESSSCPVHYSSRCTSLPKECALAVELKFCSRDFPTSMQYLNAFRVLKNNIQMKSRPVSCTASFSSPYSRKRLGSAPARPGSSYVCWSTEYSARKTISRSTPCLAVRSVSIPSSSSSSKRSSTPTLNISRTSTSSNIRSSTVSPTCNNISRPVFCDTSSTTETSLVSCSSFSRKSLSYCKHLAPSTEADCPCSSATVVFSPYSSQKCKTSSRSTTSIDAKNAYIHTAPRTSNQCEVICSDAPPYYSSADVSSVSSRADRDPLLRSTSGGINTSNNRKSYSICSSVAKTTSQLSSQCVLWTPLCLPSPAHETISQPTLFMSPRNTSVCYWVPFDDSPISRPISNQEHRSQCFTNYSSPSSATTIYTSRSAARTSAFNRASRYADIRKAISQSNPCASYSKTIPTKCISSVSGIQKCTPLPASRNAISKAISPSDYFNSISHPVSDNRKPSCPTTPRAVIQKANIRSSLSDSRKSVFLKTSKVPSSSATSCHDSLTSALISRTMSDKLLPNRGSHFSSYNVRKNISEITFIIESPTCIFRPHVPSIKKPISRSISCSNSRSDATRSLKSAGPKSVSGATFVINSFNASNCPRISNIGNTVSQPASRSPSISARSSSKSGIIKLVSEETFIIDTPKTVLRASMSGGQKSIPRLSCSKSIIRSGSRSSWISDVLKPKSRSKPRTVPSVTDISSIFTSESFLQSISQSTLLSAKNDPESSRIKHRILGRKLLRAAQEGRSRVVSKLLDDGAGVNFTFATKWTALHRAVKMGHDDVVAVLLKNGADLEAKTSYGFTALHMAAYYDRRCQCLTLLINAGSDLSSRNRSGKTPLHYASEMGNTAAVRALILAGASVSSSDTEGRTPYDVAKFDSIRRLLTAAHD